MTGYTCNMIVACIDENGDPTFTTTVVKVTQDEYDVGVQYLKAVTQVGEGGSMVPMSPTTRKTSQRH